MELAVLMVVILAQLYVIVRLSDRREPTKPKVDGLTASSSTKNVAFYQGLNGVIQPQTKKQA